MKNKFNIVYFISLLSLLFILTQDIVYYCIPAEDRLNIELAETGSEEEIVDKEIKYLPAVDDSEYLSNCVSTQLKHNIDFFNSLYANPFISRDIKPPHIL